MPTIYKMESICSRSRIFDAGVFKAAKAQCLAARGRAMLIVHPLSSESFSADEYLERRQPDLFRQIMEKDFDAYARRFERAVKNTTMAPFIIFGESSSQKAENLINGLGLNKRVYSLNSDTRDPTPYFDFNSVMSPWYIFSEMMKGVGISKVYIAGELAYYERSEKVGCVYSVFNELSPYLPVKVFPRLTYPGLF